MKSTYSEEYYKSHRDLFVNKKGVLDLDKELSSKMECLNGLNITEEQKASVRKSLATEIYNKNRADLVARVDEMARIQKNPSVLGYVNKAQETRSAHDVLTVFDFNCLLLKEFKEKEMI